MEESFPSPSVIVVFIYEEYQQSFSIHNLFYFCTQAPDSGRKFENAILWSVN